MTAKVVGAIAAGTLAIGILIGAAGAVLVNGWTMPRDHMTAMGDPGEMHEMMAAMDDGPMTPGASTDPPHPHPSR